MSKAAEMAKTSAKGGFHLLWGLVASTVISSIGTIFIGNLLGDTRYGLYTIAMVAPNLIATFRDWGMNTAMIKYSAQYNAENKCDKIRSIFAAGIIFEVALGLLLTVVAFLLSGFLATLYNEPELPPLIQIASFTILTGALLTTAQSAFVGLERLELNSITIIFQSIIKTAVILLLVLAGFGPLGAVLGYTIAFLMAGIIGILLMWTLYRKLPKPANNKLEIKSTIKTMFNYGMPLSIATIVGGFQTQFYNFIVPIYVSTQLMGNYGIANTFVVLITFFASPITTILFPAFSKLDAQKDCETLKNVFQFSVKYASLLVVPVAAIVMVLSKPGIGVLFPNYPEAPLFLALLAISHFLTAAGNLSVGNLINSQGQTRFNLKLALLTSAIGFPLSVVLISQFGIIGLIGTAIVAGIPSLIIALIWAKRNYGVTVDWASSAKILLSAAAASAITYAAITYIALSNWASLIVGAIIFLAAFMLAILLTKAIGKSDIENLRSMLGGLGPLRRPINFFLRIIEKVMNTLRL
ncbi:MAG: oligosaccharide flippase family protein [Candidatus Bathyarchaeota archaeon]|nr:oligosaccharide flippase family protein [Candidatus Bathyarchaeota archaeon]